MLSTEKLLVGYGSKAVLEEVDLSVEAGSFLCILGRNGAGKSTLMRTLAGLQPALGGRALLGGEDVAALRAATRARRIAVVLTEREFSPALRVEDVVALGRQPYTSWQGRLSAEDSRIVDDSLTRVAAEEFRGRYFDDLSDGERQRVMIARAIAQTASLLILDEITAFLDLPGRVEVMALLRRHARETGSIVLLSSHDLDLSLQLADEVWLVQDGTLRSGSPQSLIEDGAVAAAFDTADVRYSTAEQRFLLSEVD